MQDKKIPIETGYYFAKSNVNLDYNNVFCLVYGRKPFLRYKAFIRNYFNGHKVERGIKPDFYFVSRFEPKAYPAINWIPETPGTYLIDNQYLTFMKGTTPFLEVESFDILNFTMIELPENVLGNFSREINFENDSVSSRTWEYSTDV